MTSVFDEDALMEQADGDIEFLADMVTILIEDSDPLLTQVQDAATSQDAAALVSPAHTLKGMLANFHAPSATAAALELESMGRKQALENVEAACDRLQGETRHLIEALQAFLKAKMT